MWDMRIVMRRRVFFLLCMTFVFHAVFVLAKSLFAPESHRDKARHTAERGQDSKWVETEQLQDHEGNKGGG